jgi:hypothetical protein
MERHHEPTLGSGPQPRAQLEVEKRITFYRLPPDSFDALAADDAELALHGLPPRPDRIRSVALHAFWQRMFAPPLSFIHPEVDIRGDLRHLLRAGGGRGGEAGPMAFVPTRWGSSRNWSGAVITARDSMLFQTIAGRWTVPAPAPPVNANAALPPPGGAWQCSVWLGFDGYHRWSVSLPQMGTVSMVEVQGGALVPSVYAFAQWWVRGKFFGEVRIPAMPLSPGDEIFCMLSARDAGEVTFAMTNRTQNHSLILSWAPGEMAAEAGRPAPVRAPMEGRTAVWCVERPLTMPEGPVAPALFNLPRIEDVHFGEALAEMRDPAAPARAIVPRDLTAARLLRMVATLGEGDRQRSMVLTTPAAPAAGGSALSIRQV